MDIHQPLHHPIHGGLQHIIHGEIQQVVHGGLQHNIHGGHQVHLGLHQQPAYLLLVISFKLMFNDESIS